MPVPFRRHAPAWVVLLCFCAFVAVPASAQEAGFVWGRVMDVNSRYPVEGATVVLAGTLYATTTDEAGRFAIDDVETGDYTVEVIAFGYEPFSRAISVADGDVTALELYVVPQAVDRRGLDLFVLRPDLTHRVEIDARALREAHVTAPPFVLRGVPGHDAARYGGAAAGPVVRGLHEPAVATYLDGVRFLTAGGVYRVGSEMSVVDPALLARVETVRGPHALVWGSGNLSAVRLHTLGTAPVARPVTGSVQAGTHGNGGRRHVAGTLGGASDLLQYWFAGTYRRGGDYEAGDGSDVPADFRAGSLRGRVGLRVTPNARVIVSGAAHNERDVDLPGAPLDVDARRVRDVAARYQLTLPGGTLTALDAVVFYNAVATELDNDGRPSPLPDTVAAGPLRLQAEEEHRSVGGRLAMRFEASDVLHLEAGADLQRVWWDGERTAAWALPTDPLLDSTVVDGLLPEATTSQVGLFVNVTRQLGRLDVAGTGRIDFGRADANDLSPFYVEALARRGVDEADHRGLSTSMAFSVTAPVGDAWRVSFGAGTVQRMPTAYERYADRVLYHRAYVPIEVVGRPNLEPERSTQLDLWATGRLGRMEMELSVFGRLMSDYITPQPSVAVPRLPGRGTVVYQFANGAARFYGAEVDAEVALLPFTRLLLGASYVRGQDVKRDAPALGVPPARADVGLRTEVLGQRFVLEALAHVAAEQTRAAEDLGETPTDGYATFDLRSAVALPGRAFVVFAVENLTDVAYAHHVNARRWGAGAPVLEPGRSVSLSVKVSW